MKNDIFPAQPKHDLDSAISKDKVLPASYMHPLTESISQSPQNVNYRYGNLHDFSPFTNVQQIIIRFLIRLPQDTLAKFGQHVLENIPRTGKYGILSVEPRRLNIAKELPQKICMPSPACQGVPCRNIAHPQGINTLP